MSDFQTGDKFRIEVTIGDRNKNKKPDVTVEVYADVPLDGKATPRRILTTTALEVPLEAVADLIALVVSQATKIAKTLGVL